MMVQKTGAQFFEVMFEGTSFSNHPHFMACWKVNLQFLV